MRGNAYHKLVNNVEDIITKYNLGHSTNDIAKEYSSAPSSVLKLLKRRNIDIRTLSEALRTYSVDESYFDKIDTEDKAYFLGLLYADGCNREEDGVISIGLQDIDLSIIEKFKSYIQSDAPIKFRDNSHRVKNEKNSFVFNICSKKLSQSLVKLGCPSRKTFILEFPTDDIVPESLKMHFIRGFFDGDGSVFITGDGYKTFSILGTYSMVKNTQNFLIDLINIHKTKINKRVYPNGTEIYEFRYSGDKACNLIRAELYKDATVYMQRKHDKFFLPDKNHI